MRFAGHAAFALHKFQISVSLLSPFQGSERLGGISLPQVPPNLRFVVNWGWHASGVSCRVRNRNSEDNNRSSAPTFIIGSDFSLSQVSLLHDSPKEAARLDYWSRRLQLPTCCLMNGRELFSIHRGIFSGSG
jgi:hypothetical protein